MIRLRLNQQYSNHIWRVSFVRQTPTNLSVNPRVSAKLHLKQSWKTYSTGILVKMSSEKKVGKPSAEKGKSMPKSFLDEIKERGNKVTRSYTKEAEKNWREHFIKLPIEEKRKLYHCGKKYVCLDGVEGWSSYAAKVKRKAKPLFDVDEELNMKLSLWRGDITTLEIEVICNAANNSLLGGGGVDGAIHRAAGRKLYEECDRLGGCKTGDAELTGGYKLPAKYILHTVGPIGEQPEALKSCYQTCLNLAKKNKLRTIAFPCISTGIYGYDVEKATPVVMQTVRDWLLIEENGNSIDKIIFCVFLIKDVEVYEKNLQQYFPVIRPDNELPEKKKPKTVEETNGNTKKDKEQKDNKTERKTEKDQKELKSETEKKESESELPEKKKPKTVEETNGNTKKDKEQKDNKTERKTEKDQKELKSETEKKESERNNSKTSSL